MRLWKLFHCERFFKPHLIVLCVFCYIIWLVKLIRHLSIVSLQWSTLLKTTRIQQWHKQRRLKHPIKVTFSMYLTVKLHLIKQSQASQYLPYTFGSVEKNYLLLYLYWSNFFPLLFAVDNLQMSANVIEMSTNYHLWSQSEIQTCKYCQATTLLQI